MTPAQELLAKMVEDGCALGATEAGSARFFPAVAEIIEDKLFWVNQFASDQHDIHRIKFSRVTPQPGDVGLAFTDDRGGLLAYVAPYAEWPDVNADDAREEHSRWREYLRDPSNKAAFDGFVDSERSLIIEGD